MAAKKTTEMSAMEILFGVGCLAIIAVTLFLIHRERRNQ
jgi:hypothetical protein